MKVLVCGDRNWNDPKLIKLRLKKLSRNTIIIHGAARGADTLAGIAAKELGMEVIEFPAKWNIYGIAAGPIRNQQMLEQNPDLVIAFHDDIDSSKGTKDMMNRAKRKGIPTELHGKEIN